MSKIEETNRNNLMNHLGTHNSVAQNNLASDTINYFKSFKAFTENYDYIMQLGILHRSDLLPKGTIIYGTDEINKIDLLDEICSELNLPYSVLDLAKVDEAYVNSTSLSIQRCFDEAAGYIKREESKVSVMAIDEIDIIGKKRSGKSNEHDKVIATLINNLIGSRAVDGVIVFGVTSNPYELDAAITKRGRFTKKIEMSYPCKEELNTLFGIYQNNEIER